MQWSTGRGGEAYSTGGLTKFKILFEKVIKLLDGNIIFALLVRAEPSQGTMYNILTELQ